MLKKALKHLRAANKEIKKWQESKRPTSRRSAIKYAVPKHKTVVFILKFSQYYIETSTKYFTSDLRKSP